MLALIEFIEGKTKFHQGGGRHIKQTSSIVKVKKVFMTHKVLLISDYYDLEKRNRSATNLLFSGI